MRKTCFKLAGLLLTGCASQPPAMQTRNISPEISRASSALVFDAPITFDQPPIDPARDDRGLSAFAGYESGSVSYYNTFTDNRAGNGRGDRFVKRPMSSNPELWNGSVATKANIEH